MNTLTSYRKATPFIKRSVNPIRRGTILLGMILAFSTMNAQNFGLLKKIFDPDGAEGDNYAWSVGVSDSVAVVGAPLDDTGSVHVYFRNEGGTDNWGFVRRLSILDGGSGDGFGWSVDVSDTIVVAGAPLQDGGGSNRGAAYVFSKNTGGPDNWGLVTKLVPTGTGSQDQFGYEVSISGTVIAVSAPNNTEGTVHLFYKDNGGLNNWGEETVLMSSDAASGDEFGHSIDLRDTLMIIGAPGNDVGGLSDRGAAYVFYQDNDNWTEQQVLTAADGEQGDRFGTSVAVDSITAVVGAPLNSEEGLQSGAAYLYTRDEGGVDNWGELPVKLVGSSTAADDRFGSAVAISGEAILIGAPQDDDSGASSGTSFLFGENQGGAGNWGETQRLQAFDAVSGDLYGFAVDIEGPFLYVGAPSDDDSGLNSGSVYIYQEDEVICPDVPTVDCQDITVYLDESGVVEVNPDSINIGANASCEFNVTLSQSIFTCSDIGDNAVTLTLIDIIGNQVSCDAIVTVEDTLAPSFITCPSDTLTVSNNADACEGNIIWSVPSAQDNCAIDSIVQTAGPTPGTAIALGIYDIQYVAYDQQGLTDTCSFVLEIVDTQAPFLACPPDLTFENDIDECNWTSAEGQLEPLIAIDNCQPVLSYTITTSEGNMSSDSGAVLVFDFPVGVNTICYMIMDSAGTEGDTCCFTITVLDEQAPELTCPSDMTIGTDDGVCEALYAWTHPIPTDNCEIDSLTISYMFSDGTGSMSTVPMGEYGGSVENIFPEGLNTVIYVAYDTSGNFTACTFDVLVEDDEAPVITCPGDAAIVTSDGGIGNCTGALTFTHPVPTDNCEITSYTYQILNPDGSVQGPLEISGGDMVTREFDLGTSTISYIVEDAYGNSTVCTYDVVVADDENPEFISCPLDTVTVGTNVDVCGANVNWATPIAEDNCTVDSVSQISGPMSGDSLAPGFYTIVYVAYDAATPPNTDTCTFVVRVIDTQNPTIACPSNEVVVSTDPGQCSWAAPVGSLSPIVASGNCPFEVTWEVYKDDTLQAGGSDDVSGNHVFDLGESMVCYYIIETEDPDSNGLNTDTCCFLVIVEDNEPPVVTCPPDATFQDIDDMLEDCQHTMGSTALDATATDNCSVISLTHDYDSAPDSSTLAGAVWPVGVTVITWIAVDTAGNVSTCSFTVTVEDNIPPFVACPADTSIVTSDGGIGDCEGELAWTHPTPTDNCAVTQYNYTITNADGTQNGPFDLNALLNPGSPIELFDAEYDFQNGTSTVAYHAEDAAGNVFDCSFDVTVTDDEAPSFINCPSFDTIMIGTDVNNCSAVVNWSVPIAEDNCFVTVSQIEGPMPGDELAPGFYTVTYVAADSAAPANTDTCSFVVNIIDTQDPLIACPSNDVVASTDAGQCSWTSPDGSLSPIIAIANCPYIITWEVYKSDTLQGSGSDDVSGYTFDLDTSWVCYYIEEAEDPDSNGILTDTCCFMVIVQDNEPPVVICPPDVTFQDTDDMVEDCQHTMGSTALDATATDNCSVISLTHDYDSAPDSTTLVGAVWPVGVTIITWIAVDTAGNVSTCSFTVTVEDNVSPFVDCPADTSIVTSDGGVGDCEGELAWTHPTPTDNCAVTQYNYTITNADGTQNGPFDLNALLNPGSPSELFDAEYDFQNGTSTVAYHAEDAAGNVFDCTFDVTVTDDEAPEFVNCPSFDTIMVGTDVNNCSAVVNWSVPIAEDNCFVTVSQTEGPMPGEELAPGFYTVTYVAADSAAPANTDTCSFVVNVIDTQDPLISCPSNDVVASTDDGQCSWTSPDGSLSPIVAIANCPYIITWEVYKNDTLQASGSDDVSGYTFDLDTSWVCYYIEEADDPDSNGILTDTCCFLVIVQDNEVPMITCPADVTFLDTDDGMEDCQHTMGSTELDPSASDNCAVVSITHNYANAPDSSTLQGAVWPVGMYVITWTAVDTAGNVASCSFTVTVEDDVAPMLTCPTDTTIATSAGGANGCVGELEWTHATATDNCNIFVLHVSYENPDGTTEGPDDILTPPVTSGDRQFDIGTTIVTYYAEDSTGNSASCTFLVTVTDDEVPIFLNCPDTLTFANDPSECSALVNWADPIAVDNCNDTIMAVQTGGPASGSEFNVGEFILVTYTATDADGNSATCTFVVTIEDTEAPTAICQDTVIYVDSMGVASITADDINGGSTDNCGVDSVGITMTNFDCNNLGENNVLLTVVDSAGNIAACVAEVTVLDTIGPEFTCPADTAVSVCEQVVPDLISGLVGTDNCSGVTFEQNPLPGVLFIVAAGDTFNVIITATDESGNTTTCEVGVPVFAENCSGNCLGDIIPPEWINCPRPPINVSAEPDMCSAFVNFSLPVALDNCELDTIIQIDTTGLTTGDMFPVGLTILKWLAIDTEGNISDTCRIKVFVNDQQPPQILCPSDTTVITELGECGASISGLGVIAVDNCLTAITYKVTDTDKFDIDGAGGGDGDIIDFGCGTFEVTYMVSDQPVLLISEVTHELEAFVGGTNPVPAFIQTTDGDDFVEITNYGPADMDVSCLTIERMGGNNEVFVVPDGTILEVGDVLTLHYGGGTDSPENFFFNVPGAADLTQGTPAGYVISIDTVALDVAAVNGFNPVGAATMSSISILDWSVGVIPMSLGGSAYRQWAWDSNNAEDYAVSDLCMLATIGSLNPGTELIGDLGITYSLQSLPPNKATCSFLVTVTDTELPNCGELIPMQYAGPGISVGPGEVQTSVIDVPDDFQLGDVNLLDIIGTHDNMAEVRMKLMGPQNNVLLISGLCGTEDDFDFSLDNLATQNIVDAPCGPLGAGGTYQAIDDLNVFTGDQSQGQWVLTIANSDPLSTLVLDGWTLELSLAAPYSQGDTTLPNDPGECGALFMWTHPVVLDNCAVGTVSVEYSSQDSIDVPEGGEVEAGSLASEFFAVGTTTVTYTITDKLGNENMCSFDVTVEDVEPALLLCPNDIIISLGPGECAQTEDIAPDVVGDNCNLDTVIFIPPPGTNFPVGTTEVTIIAIDEAGNIDSCTFNVTVIEYIPQSDNLACNDLVNLSLDYTCMYEIGADIILEGDDYGCYDDYCIYAIDGNGDTIPDNIITTDYVGDTLTVTVVDCEGTGNSCWGLIYVEDKLGPVVECPDDITVACNESTDTSITGVPTVLNCEISTSIDFVDEVIQSDECGDPRVIIHRTWYVTDNSGNTSSCEQTVTVQAYDPSQVEFPADFIGAMELLCEDVAADPSLTEPENTGYPTINGQPIFGDHFCEINVGYWDEFLQDANCPGSYELLRNWIIRDECNPLEPGINPLRHIQSIMVKDRTAPEINAWIEASPANSSNDECTGVVYIGADPVDACTESSQVSWKVLYTEGIATQIVAFGELPLDSWVELPLGNSYEIVFYADDQCRNIATDTIAFDLFDIIPPVAICDQHTIVSLTEDGDIENGLTKIPVLTFDDGSYDNCDDFTIDARRMTSCINVDWTGPFGVPDGVINGLDRGTSYSTLVPFACCDVGQGPIMVEFRVTDAQGNQNTCMVEVEVQDKLSPLLECPPSVAVSCDFWFEAHETNGFVDQSEDPLGNVFGVVLDGFNYDLTDRQAVVIDDPGRPNSPSDPDYLAQPYVWGIDGWSDDNCETEITVRVEIFDDCSGEDIPGTPPTNADAVKLIRRSFRAVDSQGNSTVCQQLIWVVDFDPFYISDETCVNADPQDGVIWPCDEEYDFCPQNGIPVNYPTVFDDNCSLIAVTYEDQQFDFVDGACYKIIRTWSIIDWCQYNSQTGEGQWTYQQVIKVIDNEPAFILGCYPEPQTRTVLDNGVTLPANNQVFLGEENPLATSCSVHYADTFGLEEYCSGEVLYDVKVYPFNGPDFLQVQNQRTAVIDSNGYGELVIDTKTSDILGVRLNGLPYNDRYCVNGEKEYHRVLISVEDGCGNLNTCEYLLRLEDGKAPTPVCLGLSSVLMPSSGEVTIWAADFNASSFDDCTASEDLIYSFSGDNYEPSRTFDCAMIEANGTPSFFIEIWAADEGNDQDCDGEIEWDERNKDFCSTFIVIDDNENHCGIEETASGVIETEELDPVESVLVSLTDESGSVMSSFTTTETGQYVFFNPLLTYRVSAERNDDHTNGVSTLDLVQIQKHLLGIEEFETPYQYIAADANNNQNVSALDLVEIRKLILGVYPEYPENTSWRFVDASQVFNDPTAPWPFREVIQLQGGTTNDKDFVGVKIGDVNGTVTANAKSVETRELAGVLEFTGIDRQFEAGERVEIPVTSENFVNVVGYQFTMMTQGLVLRDITPGVIDMSMAFAAVHQGAITASWNRIAGVSARPTDVLFTLVFDAQKSGKVSEMVSIGSRITAAEAYDAEANTMDVSIRFVEPSKDAAGLEFALFQNDPNPFRDVTDIAFTLPEAMSATITIFDVTGKTLEVIEGDYPAGLNSVKVNRTDLGASGMLYYRFDTDGFTATKKMIVAR